jgi:hypothetical protein
MGIDVHGLNFLKFARNRQAFGCVATIGRQSLSLSSGRLKKLLNLDTRPRFGPYCEDLLTTHFAAAAVESFDNSDYENATHIADMNKPLTISNRYDTVIDCGTIEHIYNVPQAFKNVSQMCSEAGQILHILPANDYCGHGFWQFSPELFFSLYSEANGYHDTQVFLADLTDERFWYEGRRPQNGQRADVMSSTQLLVLVRTTKKGAVSHEDVQQSDYLHTWNRKKIESGLTPAEMPIKNRIKEAIKQSSFASSARVLNGKWKAMRRPTAALSARNPRLVKLEVLSLIEEAAALGQPQTGR